MVSASSRAGGGAGGPQTAPHQSKPADDTPVTVPYADFIAEVDHVMNRKRAARAKTAKENPRPQKRARLA